jgi:hypothetical protein
MVGRLPVRPRSVLPLIDKENGLRVVPGDDHRRRMGLADPASPTVAVLRG